jgi:hypothetical protein
LNQGWAQASGRGEVIEDDQSLRGVVMGYSLL